MEASKQKKLFFSVLLINILLFFLLPYITVGNDWNPLDKRSGSLLFLLAANLFFSLIFTSNGATGIRSDPARAVEEGLPVRPFDRVSAAFLVNLVYYLLIFFPVFAIFHAAPGKDIIDFQRYGTAWIVFFALELHLFGFLFSYWIHRPLLGGFAAAVWLFIHGSLISGLESFCYMRLHDLSYPVGNVSLLRDWTSLLLSFLLIAAAGLPGLFWLSRRVEREQKVGILRGATYLWLIVSSLFFSLILFVLPLGQIAERQLSAMQFAMNSHGSFGYWQSNTLRSGDATQLSKPNSKGVLLQNWHGDLIRVFSSGESQVLYRVPHWGTFRILQTEYAGPFHTPDVTRHRRNYLHPLDEITEMIYVADILSLEDGNIWAILCDRSQKDSCRLMRAQTKGSFRIVAEFKREEGSPLLYADENGKVVLWNVDPEEFESVPVQAFDSKDRYFESKYAEGILAKLDITRKHLAWLGGGCDLPGRSVSWDLVPTAYDTTSSKGFAINVSDQESGSTLIVCNTDGTMQEFPGAFGRFPVPGADVTAYLNSEHIQVITKEGTIFPPVSLKTLTEDRITSTVPYVPMEFLRFSGSHLWINLDRKFLLEVDMRSGKLIRETRFPERGNGSAGNDLEFNSLPSADGIYYSNATGLYLMDWSGKTEFVSSLR